MQKEIFPKWLPLDDGPQERSCQLILGIDQIIKKKKMQEKLFPCSHTVRLSEAVTADVRAGMAKDYVLRGCSSNRETLQPPL